MKKALHLIALYFFIINFLYGQGKEGDIWVMGYPPDPDFPVDFLGGTIVDFNSGKPDTSRFVTKRGMSSSSIVSDENGNLLFYSNGCDILNREHEIMLNGDDINATGSAFYNQYCANGISDYNVLQDMLSFVWPKQNSLYQIIHIRYEPFKQYSEIWSATVDIDSAGGLGKVVERNIKLFDKGLTNGYMTAVRHGNGSDWWITVP